jgi:hypothetical protein
MKSHVSKDITNKVLHTGDNCNYRSGYTFLMNRPFLIILQLKYANISQKLSDFP